MARVGLSASLFLPFLLPSVPARTEQRTAACKVCKASRIAERPGRHVMLLPELWRGGYRATHFRRPAEGDHMVNYERMLELTTAPAASGSGRRSDTTDKRLWRPGIDNVGCCDAVDIITGAIPNKKLGKNQPEM